MAVIVKGDRITFPEGDQIGPGASMNTLKVQAQSIDSATNGKYGFSTHYNWDRRITSQSARGQYYVKRADYGTIQLTDAYGNVYYTNGLGVNGTTYDDVVTFTNNTSYSLTVNIRSWAGRWTDDADYHIVYRGGSISNAYTHSGGTQLRSSSGDVTVTDTIPANTTYTYYHYCGSPGGSGGDTLNPYFTVSFKTWNI